MFSVKTTSKTTPPNYDDDDVMMTSCDSVLVSMAPLSQEVQSISSCVPPHVGPAVSEVTSIWFKLWLYSKLASGPHSILLSRGTRLRRLPAVLKVMTSSLCHMIIDCVCC